MALSLEQTMRLSQIRQAVNSGTATDEMLREGIAILRQDRVAAQIASTTSRSAKAPVDTQAALAGLKALANKLNSGPVA